jgi:hypothetical protein
MALTWLRDAEAGPWRWQPLAAPGYSCVLGADGAIMLLADGAADVQLRPAQAGRSDAWVLLVAPSARVFVNGELLLVGVHKLQDRDEVYLSRPAAPGPHPAPPADAGARFYFSTERLAEVVPLPGDKPITCARCTADIVPGMLAVHCPSHGCPAWHHQTADLPCWTYAEHCAGHGCAQPTALDVGFRWTPGDL